MKKILERDLYNIKKIPEWEEFERKIKDDLHFCLDIKRNLPESLENPEIDQYELLSKDSEERVSLYEEIEKKEFPYYCDIILNNYRRLLYSEKDEIIEKIEDDVEWIDYFINERILKKYKNLLLESKLNKTEIQLEDMREALKFYSPDILKELKNGFLMTCSLLDLIEKTKAREN